MWRKRAEVVVNAARHLAAAHWKKACLALLSALLFAGAAAGAKYFVFEIEGTVARVDGGKVAVVDFLTTRVVDFAESPVDPSRVRPGDKVEIKRNLQGMVYALKVKRQALEGARFLPEHGARR